jgi:hypothetical protein
MSHVYLRWDLYAIAWTSSSACRPSYILPFLPFRQSCSSSPSDPSSICLSCSWTSPYWFMFISSCYSQVHLGRLFLKSQACCDEYDGPANHNRPIYRSISQAVLRVEYVQYNTAQYPKYASVLSRNTISVNTPDSILCVCIYVKILTSRISKIK